jgi:hypothetical protein
METRWHDQRNQLHLWSLWLIISGIILILAWPTRGRVYSFAAPRFLTEILGSE